MRRLAVALAVAILACSAKPQPNGSHGLPTPLRTDVAPSASAPVAVAADGWSLERFTPLLASPALARVAQAVEREDQAGAARELEAAMAKQPPPEGEVVRWQFLLARIREQAGDSRGAAASYELAAARDWPLVGYAWLGAGRVRARLGQLDAAVERLARVPGDLPVVDETRLLRAEVAVRRQDVPEAVRLWREHLASGEAPRDRAAVALRLAGALLTGTQPDPAAAALEALDLARRTRFEQIAAPDVRQQATELEQRALAALPPAERARRSTPTPEEQLVGVEALVAAREFTRAEAAAEQLLGALTGKQRWQNVGCEATLLRGKALAGNEASGRAADQLLEVIQHCSGDDLRARALYLAGKYAAADGRHAQALKLYVQLERELPKHRLADDARLQEALSSYELGDEARFTELLSRMPEDFPEGDMVIDGIFRLAMRRIEKGDWAGAATVLDRAAGLVREWDGARGTELSGRERYFRARAWMATGERARGLDELAALVDQLPLGYYTLHAYARLLDADPARARSTRAAAERRAAEQPFSFPHRPEFDQPGFVRAMELLREGEVDLAKQEIETLGLSERGAAPGVLWGVALLYARSGSVKLSHSIARGLLTDWLGHWPAGDWAKAWEIAFPRPYLPLVRREAERNGIPQSLVYAVMREESAFDPDARSPADAYGLMQLIVPTAKLYAPSLGLPYDAASLRRPAVSIAIGCRALAKLREGFAGNPVLAVPAYNAGPGRPRRWLRDRPRLDFDVWVELISIGETRRYIKRVLASQAAYGYLYEREPGGEILLLPLRLEP
jgi:soluble lytic murein transglycosylase